MAVDTGGGAALTFVTSGTTVQATSIAVGGTTRAAVNSSDLSTTTAHTFVPGDLYDPGTITVQFNTDVDVLDDFMTLQGAAAETVRVTLPLPAGQGTAGKVEANGFVTDIDDVTCELDTLMTGSMTIKLSGAKTYTDSAL